MGLAAEPSPGEPGRARELYAETEERFPGAEVPLPPHWGGFRLQPESYEFWQHGDDRLHDRVRYEHEGGAWRRERLAP